MSPAADGLLSLSLFPIYNCYANFSLFLLFLFLLNPFLSMFLVNNKMMRFRV